MIAPSKAYYFEEYIPSYLIAERSQTNYAYYSELLEETEVPVFDAHQWFLDIKDTTTYPIMSKAGIHWTKYGASIVADSLTSCLENIFNRKLYRFQWDTVEMATDYRGGEYDLGNLINLYFPIPDQPYAYPGDFRIEPNEDGFKPATTVIGDSFYWLMYDTVLAAPYKNLQYWYYYNSIFPVYEGKQKTIKEIDVISEIAKKDLVILVMSSQNFHVFGFRFLDDIYKVLILNDQEKRLLFTEQFRENINNSPQMIEMIKEKALVRGIPVDSMIYLDAQYLADQKLNRLFHGK